MKPLLMAVAIVAGALLALQPAINAELARRAGSPHAAAVISLLVSLAVLAPIALVWGRFGGRAAFADAPWWALLGGVAGAVFVLAGIAISPALGAVAFIACIVGGQFLGSMAADQFGLFGLTARPADGPRLAGIALMLLGLARVLRD